MKIEEWLALRFASEAPLPSSVSSTAHVEVPGVRVVENFISELEETFFLKKIDEKRWENRIKRRVQHYGRDFDYGKLTIGERGRVGPMPDFCLPLIKRLEESGYLRHPLDQLTVNECGRAIKTR